MNTTLLVWLGMTAGGLALVHVGATWPIMFGLVLGGLALIAVGHTVLVLGGTSAARNRSLDKSVEDNP